MKFRKLCFSLINSIGDVKYSLTHSKKGGARLNERVPLQLRDKEDEKNALDRCH